MIEVTKDGKMLLSFDDWTPLMMAMTIKLYQLPPRPNDPKIRNHEAGIDELNRMPHGDLALDLLADHIYDLDHCPSSYEVMELGKALLKTHAEFQIMRERRRRDRTHLQDRAKLRPDQIRQSVGKVVYRRGN
jgi:hypothetical protein